MHNPDLDPMFHELHELEVMLAKRHDDYPEHVREYLHAEIEALRDVLSDEGVAP